MRIGLSELILILVFILAFMKPDKLKEYAATLSEALSIVKSGKKKVEEEVIDPLKEDINTVTEPIKDVTQPIKETVDFIKTGN